MMSLDEVELSSWKFIDVDTYQSFLILLIVFLSMRPFALASRYPLAFRLLLIFEISSLNFPSKSFIRF